MLTGASELSFLVTAWCKNMQIHGAVAVKMLTEVAINYGRKKKF